jgi:hypothetical protein
MDCSYLDGNRSLKSQLMMVSMLQGNDVAPVLMSNQSTGHPKRGSIAELSSL